MNHVDFYKNWKSHYKYIHDVSKISKERVRCPIIHELISESIIQKYINNTKSKKTGLFYTCINPPKGVAGDLIKKMEGCEDKIIEVKASTSNGPSSFGPAQKFDELYWIDMKNIYHSDNVHIYHIKLSSMSDRYLNYNVNKTETICDQKNQKRRPRIKMKSFIDSLPSKYVHCRKVNIVNILNRDT